MASLGRGTQRLAKDAYIATGRRLATRSPAHNQLNFVSSSLLDLFMVKDQKREKKYLFMVKSYRTAPEIKKLFFKF